MIFGLIAVVVYAIGRLATILPDHVAAALATTRELGDHLASIGIGPDQIRELTQSVNLFSLANWLTAQLPSVLSLTTALVLVYSLLMFIGIESAQVRYRATALLEDHPRPVRSLQGFVANTRRYVAITGRSRSSSECWTRSSCWCSEFRSPFCGGSSRPPATLLALLDQGWQSMLLAIAVYLILNSIITTILPARFVGNAVGMSMTVTMASVAFWSWVLGRLGAVLAIPLSLLVKAIFIDSVPSARWLAGFVDAAPRRDRRPH